MPDISRSLYRELSFENYTTQKIDDVEIRNGANTIIKQGTGSNNYILKGNILCEGMTAEDITTASNNLLSQVSDIIYTPCEATAKGNPCLEVGDSISFVSEEGYVGSYMLQRTLEGIQEITDNYVSEGDEYLTFNISDTRQDINQLTRMLGSFDLRLNDVETELGAKFVSISREDFEKITPDYNTVYFIQGTVYSDE